MPDSPPTALPMLPPILLTYSCLAISTLNCMPTHVIISVYIIYSTP
jgi:hypothetical protein